METGQEKASADARTLSLLQAIADMQPRIAPNKRYKGDTIKSSPGTNHLDILDVQYF